MRIAIGLVCAGMVLCVWGCAETGGGKPAPVAQPAPATPAPPLDPVLQVAARREVDAAMASPDALRRTHAIETIREAMGSGGQAQIINGLSDPDAMVRFASAMAAGELRLAPARDALLPLVNDGNPHVRVGAVFALHRLGDTRFSRMLEQALVDPDKGVRGNTAVALGRLGEKSALKILRPRLTGDPDVAVRLQVAEAMWMLEDEQGLKYLVAAVISRFPDDQMVALLALAGPRDPRVKGHIRPSLEADYGEVALVAARAMGLLGSADGYPVAAKGVTSPDARQRFLAARAFAAIGSTRAQAMLAGLLKDTDDDVRLAAAGALLQLRP